MLQIYNSLTKQKQEFKPIQPGKIGLYVCGITAYDYCHLGHARVFVAFDTIAKFLRADGWEVKYVRNVTDIDDKIIKRANENKEEITALTTRFIQAMDEDSKSLNVEKPDLEPLATEHIGEIINMVQVLIDKGIAYVGENNDVYFSVEKYASYGALAHRDLEKLQAGSRIEVELAKKNPLDFVLWKKAKPSEPSWDSPWGKGRPGWHIECSAMSHKCLGATFDIHGGGADLKFPHHENERAQSESANGVTFVNTWMHVGFVQIDKEKMSKSLNNFFTIREILDKYDGEVVRYFLIASHYRSPVNYSTEQLDLAKNALTSLYTAIRGLDLPKAKPQPNKYLADFYAAMNDDFNTPQALAVLFELARDINLARQSEDARTQNLALTLKHCANLLGILNKEPDAFLKGDNADDIEIEVLITKREEARKNKDWATADQMRDELDKRGVILEDAKGETTWRRK